MTTVIPFDPRERAKAAMAALRAKQEAERKARAVAAIRARRAERQAQREAERAAWTPCRPGSGGVPYHDTMRP